MAATPRRAAPSPEATQVRRVGFVRAAGGAGAGVGAVGWRCDDAGASNQSSPDGPADEDGSDGTDRGSGT